MLNGELDRSVETQGASLEDVQGPVRGVGALLAKLRSAVPAQNRRVIAEAAMEEPEQTTSGRMHGQNALRPATRSLERQAQHSKTSDQGFLDRIKDFWKEWFGSDYTLGGTFVRLGTASLVAAGAGAGASMVIPVPQMSGISSSVNGEVRARGIRDFVNFSVGRSGRSGGSGSSGGVRIRNTDQDFLEKLSSWIMTNKLGCLIGVILVLAGGVFAVKMVASKIADMPQSARTAQSADERYRTDRAERVEKARQEFGEVPPRKSAYFDDQGRIVIEAPAPSAAHKPYEDIHDLLRKGRGNVESRQFERSPSVQKAKRQFLKLSADEREKCISYISSYRWGGVRDVLVHWDEQDRAHRGIPGRLYKDPPGLREAFPESSVIGPSQPEPDETEPSPDSGRVPRNEQ